jgi:hypothetical protein
MNTDKIKELVGNSELPQIQKNMLIGFINRANEEQEKKTEDREFIEEIAKEKKISEIILSTDEVMIYTVYGKEDWDIKYPYRSIYKNSKGVWERSNTVSPSLDTAYLVYLEKKHLGLNSQFVDFALKMLEIKLES